LEYRGLRFKDEGGVPADAMTADTYSTAQAHCGALGHLEEIATAVAPGAHAILVLDQAGWHVSKALLVPPNITLVSLPPKSPELNPVENIWQFMRDNWLSNRVFPPTPTSSTIAAMPGTNWSTSHG
jgi:DDE superfamily endonuclease